MGYSFYVDMDSKEAVVVASDAEKPNGVVGTPDGKTLYVADQTGGKIFKYEIVIEGKQVRLKDGMVFTEEVGPDGMTLDDQGNLYATSTDPEKHGVKVFSSDGSCILNLPFEEKVTNLQFGNDVLYFTGSKNLYSLQMQVRGGDPMMPTPTPAPTDIPTSSPTQAPTETPTSVHSTCPNDDPFGLVVSVAAPAKVEANMTFTF